MWFFSSFPSTKRLSVSRAGLFAGRKERSLMMAAIWARVIGRSSEPPGKCSPARHWARARPAPASPWGVGKANGCGVVSVSRCLLVVARAQGCREVVSAQHHGKMFFFFVSVKKMVIRRSMRTPCHDTRSGIYLFFSL